MKTLELLQHLLKAEKEEQTIKTTVITHLCIETMTQTRKQIFYMLNCCMKGMCTLSLVTLDVAPITGQPEE
jgi:hypothetical protein